MRYVKLLPPIQLVDPISKKEIAGQAVTHLQFAHQVWLSDPRHNELPMAKMRRLAKIADAFESSTGIAALEDSDWELLKPIVEDPKARLPLPLLMVQCMPFVDAFLDAPTEKPVQLLEASPPS